MWYLLYISISVFTLSEYNYGKIISLGNTFFPVMECGEGRTRMSMTLYLNISKIKYIFFINKLGVNWD